MKSINLDDMDGPCTKITWIAIAAKAGKEKRHPANLFVSSFLFSSCLLGGFSRMMAPVAYQA
jgi:hypothetical protein